MDNKIINYAKNKGLIITEKALRYLTDNNYKQILDKLENTKTIFVTETDINKTQEIINTETKKTLKKQENKSNSKNFKILTDLNYSEKYSQGKIQDFLKLFLDKYNVLSDIIKQRVDFEFKTIREAQNEVKNKPVDIIGMVYNKRLSKNENLILTVDDPTGKVNLVVVNKDEKKFLESKEVLKDNVLGFKCNVLSKDMFVVNEIIYPDIPYQNNKPYLKENSYVLILGDLHIGSKNFLEDEFNEFINWLNSDDPIVNDIKYIVIAGDVVDGIGVYPAQFDELAIKDIYKQYEVFEEYILKIPNKFEIFITSGNHDAVRLSDPQPEIPKEFCEKLYEKENIHFLGSPSWINIEGFKTLVYHGASMHGIYSEIKEAKMNQPDKAIKECLKRRDLMPQYGQRQTFVPMEKNLMVIREVPDIFIGADVHHHAYSKYKNTHIINTSCWQKMTEYQKEKGHIPTLAKVLLFNLKTQKLVIKDFLKKENEIKI